MRAWIEMGYLCLRASVSSSRPLHEGVDWNRFLRLRLWYQGSRPLHEGVDWNPCLSFLLSACTQSPSSWGRGLKLECADRQPYTYNVALFMRAWIEIVMGNLYCNIIDGRPLHEGVDWNRVYHSIGCNTWHVALFMRAWIEISRATINLVSPSVALFMRAWIEI